MIGCLYGIVERIEGFERRSKVVTFRFVLFGNQGQEGLIFDENCSHTAIDATSRPNLHQYIASNFVDISEYKNHRVFS